MNEIFKAFTVIYLIIFGVTVVVFDWCGSHDEHLFKEMVKVGLCAIAMFIAWNLSNPKPAK